jgi:predicted metal-dependent enzyme (double-stranded beta helix superfamily)
VLYEINTPNPSSTPAARPFMFGMGLQGPGLDFSGKLHALRQIEESAVVASFAARINALGSLSQVSPALRERILGEVMRVARHIDTTTDSGEESGYGRRVLYEVPGEWSIAAISLRPGQHTELHDHGGWGCAVTVQGIERNVCFAHDASGNPVLTGEQDYPQGTGYVFDASDVHQPVGADPHRVTVALHFLVHDSHPQAHAEEIIQELQAA